MAIPVILQASPQIFIQNEELRELRTQVDVAAAQVLTGTVSAKKSFVRLIGQIHDQIKVMRDEVEATVIPKDERVNFDAGDATLTDFADFETIEYYNELVKLDTYINGLNTALIDIEDAPPRPVNPPTQSTSGFQDTVTTDEFDNQGYESPVVDIQQGYSYYTVSEGETLQDIAVKLRGDPDFWTEIARANGIDDADFINQSFVGEQIRIPEEGNLLARDPGNIIYEKVFSGGDDKKVNAFLHGKDIRVHDGIIKLSPSGDMRCVEGPENTKLNIERRLKINRGALGPNNQGFGTMSVGDLQQALPIVLVIEKVVTDYEAQAAADPRVASAVAEVGELEMIGDTLSFPIQLRFVDGTRDTLKANKNLFS